MCHRGNVFPVFVCVCVHVRVCAYVCITKIDTCHEVNALSSKTQSSRILISWLTAYPIVNPIVS